MTPAHAVKKGTRYRYYYIPAASSLAPALDSSRGQRVPASNLEALVIGRLRALLADPDVDPLKPSTPLWYIKAQLASCETHPISTSARSVVAHLCSSGAGHFLGAKQRVAV